VDVAESAQRDVLDIARYIYAELSAPKAALEMVDKLDDGMRSLETNPNRHALVRDDRLAAKGYRALPVQDYLVFYKVNEQKMLVDIVRILYNRRDWVNLIY
jgi:addiction module RelE/StbE family toxin